MQDSAAALAGQVMVTSDDLPIRTHRVVHSGKVRSVYWLDEKDSARLIAAHNYPVAADAELAVMVISDRLSAFECIWHAEGGLKGVPGKGAALNAIANFWFEQFRAQGLARSHILDVPHPLVWIVQKAEPVLIEAIARQYITGSMWRAYAKGEREFCGIAMPEGLQRDQKLPGLLITPSTKGILRGIPGVPEADDVNVTRGDLEKNYAAFKFASRDDVAHYERLLQQGFDLISRHLEDLDQVFVDTKFEFGYARNADGVRELIYMDEVGTPDSSRIWDGAAFRSGKVIEKSKEGFRQRLLQYFDEPDILLDKTRMQERLALAKNNALPAGMMLEVSDTYRDMAEMITGRPLPRSENPHAEIIELLASRYALVD
ncbi:MAG: phosphoribosylaminoimidazolesuccinocarboxamide synthase [Pseudomonadales bacterium]